MDVLDDLLERNQSFSRTITLIRRLAEAPFDSRDHLTIANGFAAVARRAESAWTPEERQQVRAELRSALPRLVELVTDPDPAVRRIVSDAITAIGTDDPTIVTAIRNQADHETDDMALTRHVWALDALRQLDHERNIEACVTPGDWFARLLRHPSVEVRLAVIAVLSRRSPSVEDAIRLAHAADTPATNPILSADAHLWLDSVWPYRSLPTVELLAQKLADHPGPSARLVLATLRSRDPRIRRDATAAAGQVLMRWRTSVDEVWAAVAAGLTDAEALNGAHAAELLSFAGEAARPFTDALKAAVETDEESWPRLNSVIALAHIGDPRVLPILKQWISTGKHWSWPHPPVEVLGPFRDRAPELLPAMRARMQPEYIPLLAAWGPAGAEAVPELIAALGTADAAGACIALGAIGTEAQAAADVLMRLALGTVKPPRHAGSGPVINWYGAQSAAWAHWRITGNPAVALTVIGRAVRRGLGHAVLPYLAELGPLAGDYVDAVRPLLDLPGEWSRLESAYALWRITGDPTSALPVMMTALEPLRSGRSNDVVKTAVRYVGEIGRPAEAVVPLLEHVITSERRFAYGFSLWTIREDDELRRFAHESLRRIQGL
jgi:HEAT repeat protein